VCGLLSDAEYATHGADKCLKTALADNERLTRERDEAQRVLAHVCRIVVGLSVEAARHLGRAPESPSPHEPYRRDFTTLFGAEVAEKLTNPPPAPSTYDPDPAVQALRASRPALPAVPPECDYCADQKKNDDVD